MTLLRFAIFGTSTVAKQRYEAIGRHPATQIAMHLTAEDLSGLSDADIERALEVNTIDAVVLALPEALAIRTALIAMQSGVHVLSELTNIRSVEGIINLREAERNGSALLKFACGLRYHHSVREAKTLISEQTFGQLLTARAIYGHAGFPTLEARNHGILHGHGIHMLDLLHLFCGPFESVKAMSSRVGEAESNLFALLGTGSGTIAQLHASATSWRQTFRLELGFEEGYVWLDGHLPEPGGYGPEMLIHAHVNRRSNGAPQANPDEVVRALSTATAAEDELSEFLEAIAGRAPLRHGTSHNAFDAINIAQRICAAAERWA